LFRLYRPKPHIPSKEFSGALRYLAQNFFAIIHSLSRPQHKKLGGTLRTGQKLVAEIGLVCIAYATKGCCPHGFFNSPSVPVFLRWVGRRFSAAILDK